MSTDTAATKNLSSDDVDVVQEIQESYSRLKNELAKVIVGQDMVIEQIAICLFARGHSLLMGVPGLAKTLLISCLLYTSDAADE